MKKCKTCDKEISKYAKVCPHCGAPSTAKQIQNFGFALMGIGFLMIIGLVVFVVIIAAVGTV